MRYTFLIILLTASLSSFGQSDIRADWRGSTKVKIDLLGLADIYPAVLVGVEYPLRDRAYALEHELGPIFNSGGSQFDQTAGFKTAHTFMMYFDRIDYVIGLGVLFRQLNLSGDITVCAANNDDGSGGCAYFRLFDETIRHQRIAPYFRVRRMLYARNSVTVSFGLDIGRHFQWVTNDAFKNDNLILQNRVFEQNLNQNSDIFFRAHAQFVVRL